MPTNAEVGKVQLGVTHMTPVQGCALSSIKMRNIGKGKKKIKKSKNPEAEERKVDPGTERNTEKPQGIHIHNRESEKVL